MENENLTKICKHCKSEIPKKAKVCPNCRKKQGGIVKWITIGIIAIVIISSIASGDDEKGTDGNPKKTGETQTSSKNEMENEKVDNEFVVGDVVETSDLKISFISASPYTSDNEFLQPKDGHTYYRVEFEFENIGDSDEFVSSTDFECYADGYLIKESYISADDYLSTATISSGKKMKGAIYFEVPSNAQELKLEYEVNYFTEDKIIFKIK